MQKQQKTAENNGEEDSEDTQRAALELMRYHAQQRIAIMQGQQLNIDEELEQVGKRIIIKHSLFIFQILWQDNIFCNYLKKYFYFRFIFWGKIFQHVILYLNCFMKVD